MMAKNLFARLLLLFLVKLTYQQSRVGYAYNKNPDVIRCTGYFYYLTQSTPSESIYTIFNGRRGTGTYTLRNGELVARGSSFPGNCLGPISDLWENGIAFRIYNLERPPNRKTKSSTQVVYENPSGPSITFSVATGAITSSTSITCGSKTLPTIISQSSAFHIATQVSTAATPSISMTGDYPDFLKCDQADLYAKYIDGNRIFYQSPDPANNVNIGFSNGNYDRSSGDAMITDCTSRSLSTLITQGKAFDFNTPLLECPQDFTTSLTRPTYSVVSTGGLNLSYSRASGTSFPVGIKTTVTVTASHPNSIIAPSCTFGITIEDVTPPAITCPSNFSQSNNQIANYGAATATDDGPQSPAIGYSKASGSIFPFGVTSVTATATDGAGNMARCTILVTILDSISPDLTCPADIIQNESIVNFVPTASDNSGLLPSFLYSQDPGTEFQDGMTTVTVTARDGSGNQSQCTLDITVDREAPNLICPMNIQQKEPIASYSASATDNISRNVDIKYSVAPGSQFQEGETSVKVSAEDSAGNKSECIFFVKILESGGSNKIGIIIGVVAGVVFIAGLIALTIILIKCQRKKKGCWRGRTNPKVNYSKTQNPIE